MVKGDGKRVREKTWSRETDGKGRRKVRSTRTCVFVFVYFHVSKCIRIFSCIKMLKTNPPMNNTQDVYTKGYDVVEISGYVVYDVGKKDIITNL